MSHNGLRFSLVAVSASAAIATAALLGGCQNGISLATLAADASTPAVQAAAQLVLADGQALASDIKAKAPATTVIAASAKLATDTVALDKAIQAANPGVSMQETKRLERLALSRERTREAMLASSSTVTSVRGLGGR